jgi:acyl-CoA thioester hydrolase
MAPIDPQRPRLAAYPFLREMATRVSDIDGYGHLNAIRIGHFYEDARAAFYGQAFEGWPKVRTLVAQLTIRYLRERHWPDPVQVGTGIARVGHTSFVMAQALFQHGVCIGICDTVVVNTDAAGASPLPAAVRDRLSQMLLREAATPE